MLPNCLAYLTPLFAKCLELPEAYKISGAEMYALLQTTFPDLEQIHVAKLVHIVQNLLLNVWDDEKLRELLGIDIDFDREEHMIDMEQFKHCLQYLHVSVLISFSHILYECSILCAYILVNC